ncbi:MAG TPA: ABC transporter permease [Thermoanaerobaculia bacterium]|nr:ABC transporter permease [Thermoanaerobaculia bacterium]
MFELWQDLRYGFRLLVKYPRVSAWAVLSLALGVGANSAIFSLVDGLLLRPLPVADPGRLVAVYGTDEKDSGNLSFYPLSYPNFLDLRDDNTSLSGLFAFRRHRLSFADGRGEPELVTGQIVSTNYFAVLGVHPALGQTFTPGADRAMGGDPLVVLGHGLWQRRFGSDARIVGRNLRLNGQAFKVLGVAAPGFRGTQLISPAEFWVPMTLFKSLSPRANVMDQREWQMFLAMGRLRPGVSIAQAQANLAALARRLRETYPKANAGMGVALFSLTQSMIDPNQRQVFTRSASLLMVASGLVLLIACANVGNLLLARASDRRREIAVRLSIGAGRGRLVRQLLAESAALALTGTALGLLFAHWSSRLLWSLRPPQLDPNTVDLGVNFRMLAFTLAVALVTVLLCGLAPAREVSRTDLNDVLKTGTPLAERHRRLGWREMLVGAQVALALVALIGAGLLLASLRRAQGVDPGFHTEELLRVTAQLGAQGYKEAQGRNFQHRVVERVAALPGVRSAALGSQSLLTAAPELDKVLLPGESEAPEGRLTMIGYVGPGYFQTLGISLLRGRELSLADRQDTMEVAIVNQALARRLWPDRDPLGQHFRLEAQPGERTVVGVARDSKYMSLTEPPQPYIYSPLEQHYQSVVTLYVHADGPAERLLGPVRRAVQELDRSLPLLDVSTFPTLIEGALWAQRMRAAMLTLLGALALVLAAVGIYAVAAYSVRQRRKEIALRIALGAQRNDIMRLILRKGMLVVIAGMTFGLIAVAAITRYLEAVLFGIRTTDPWILGGTVLLLAAVALAANSLPAWRATREDARNALRNE